MYRPADPRFESPVEKQIREATERGDFDNLPGSANDLVGRENHGRRLGRIDYRARGNRIVAAVSSRRGHGLRRPEHVGRKDCLPDASLP